MDMISNASESLAQSPFTIPRDDVDMLCASQGFQVLRSYLAGHAQFCTAHADCDEHARETWLLHRDLLHALVMPVVELFRRASALAEAALCTHKSEDLELAFSGEARDAFLFLQCFLGEEQDWCRTRGCPACVTTETLSTESHIRLTIAASLLSTASVASPNSETPSTPTGATLPPLPHILPALREALSADPFWGPDHWSYLFSRATQLSAGIQALINECVNLESLVSSPPAASDKRRRRAVVTDRSVTLPGVLYAIAEDVPPEGKGARLRKSKLAKRQLRLKAEEIELMRRCALQCWAKAAVPSKIRGEILGRGDKRVRSLTCP
ncbi:hypothetical protein BS50DRAFT_544192 [Corynespora cassiicola Philippines]|uniref:Uncharacterized protein n=1 Tax=Corynespora cassiicola Philippines TaxID=1448308 RepID=A0A2T2P2N0_CORCC|nr:hypothetical protein BS50DRAFT_544192 [Corynespora cassiicola Philippines]